MADALVYALGGQGGAAVKDDMRDVPLRTFPQGLTRWNPTPGRRFRVFARIATHHMLGVPAESITLREAYEVAESDPLIRALFENRPLSEKTYIDAQLVSPLQDLAWQIARDLTEACATFDDPNAWYPGIDSGIEPVTDEHVQAVIAASQRELNRETRHGKPGRSAAPLADLPFHAQRAFAERRRWRYLQWGVNHEAWERGMWNLWDVHEDEEWVPPWV